MVNPDAASKLPRKRAGTMDSVTVRRPTRANKRLSSGGGGLKHARSTEFHASGNELRGSPLMVGGGGELPAAGFDSPRVRAGSGNSSTSGGCSPATLGTPLESSSEINPCFTMPPATWDVMYPPKQETLSESLADIFISDAAAGRNSSPSRQMYPGLPPQQPQPPMFMSNEAYAHGVPVHQPSPQRFMPAQSFSPTLGYPGVASPGGGYQPNGGGQGYGCNGGPMPTERAPTLGELLQDQHQPPSRSGYMLNTFLTSGGSVMSPPQQRWAPSPGEEAGAPPQPPSTGGTPPGRRPLHVNQRLLMQLLATKPHLARRLQQLLEAKRRQLSALESQQMAPPAMSQSVPTSSQVHATTMLQHLLTSGGPRPPPIGGLATSPQQQLPADYDITLPPDLDLNLLDLQSTSADINCDVEQVISHELAFGDKLDFSFDQLHLDEFDADFGS